MRAIILLAAIVILFALVGWITFNSDSGRTSVNIETQEIREDTKGAMEAGSDLLRKAGDDIDPDNRPATDSAPAPTTTAPY